MGLPIDDGTGQGYSAKVDSEHRLLTLSTSKSALAASSEEGQACGISTAHMTVTATGGRVLWIKNTDTEKWFRMSNVWFNWNGGSTNHNRNCQGIMYFGESVPTANHALSGAGTLNTITQSNFPLTVYVWNGTSDGMTGMTGGNPAFYFQIRQGSCVYELDSAIIIGPNSTISFNMKGEEVGIGSINMIGLMYAR